MQDFKNLKIWQLGHSLALEIYELSSLFPK